MKQYVCTICGFVYDEAAGIPDSDIAPGTLWADVPSDWLCPLCGAAKQDFAEKKAEDKTAGSPAEKVREAVEMPRLSPACLSAVFSNLGKGCEKQMLEEEAALFFKLSAYFDSKSQDVETKSLKQLADELKARIDGDYPAANAAAQDDADRGTLRALAWSEKAGRMLISVLRRFEEKGEQAFSDTGVYVCDICGYIYTGNELPDICPVCKVPNFKILEVKRR